MGMGVERCVCVRESERERERWSIFAPALHEGLQEVDLCLRMQ